MATGLCPRCKLREKNRSGYCAPCKREVNQGRDRTHERYTPVAREIECQICGWTGRFLGPHLKRHPGINTVVYRKLFPGEPTSSPMMLGINYDLWIDRNGPPRWTEERIITMLRAHARRKGRTPRQEDFLLARKTTPSWMTVVGVFGSWNKAIVAAGLKPRPAQRLGEVLWTKAKILRAVKRFYAENERIPIKTEWDVRSRPVWTPSADTVARVFGTWNAAIETAGFESQEAGRKRQLHCKRGHPFRGVNIYHHPGGRRECRRCKRLRAAGLI